MLRHDCEQRSQKSGAKGDQNHYPLWLIREKIRAEVNAEQKPGDRHKKPEELPAEDKQDET
jgi:hypothetical protein